MVYYIQFSFWSCADCGSRVEYAYLEDCKFLNNYAEDSAGAMTAHYYEVECQNCIFDSQQSDGYAGNIYTYGSWFSMFDSSVTRTNTYLSSGIWLEHTTTLS